MPKYNARWKAKKAAAKREEDKLTDEEKTYRDKLAECVHEVRLTRAAVPMLSVLGIVDRLKAIEERYVVGPKPEPAEDCGVLHGTRRCDCPPELRPATPREITSDEAKLMEHAQDVRDDEVRG